jgi:O-6-methylguanine DNA methyltransferase
MAENFLTEPTQAALHESQRRLHTWFEATAPTINWAALDSPLGTIYLARSVAGICKVDFGVDEDQFMETVDPLARTEHDPNRLYAAMKQLDEYFAGQRQHFDIPVDLSEVTDFQRSVLHAAETIPAGNMWTYGEVAKQIGKPQASRAVGQALGRNPIPIIVPCHRVIGSNGQMVGYSGGGGIESKKWLLRLEGAL